jgi:hypothetical protein
MAVVHHMVLVLNGGQSAGNFLSEPSTTTLITSMDVQWCAKIVRAHFITDFDTSKNSLNSLTRFFASSGNLGYNNSNRAAALSASTMRLMTSQD